MKVLKNKRIVVFEINDNIESRKYEYGKHSGGNYKKPFADFIESLGFEVVLQDHIDAIEINGNRFDLYLGNASYMSKNGWSREVSVRKPINRYVSIMKGYDSTLLKVHFNKEYDGDKLCKTINDEIQRKADTVKFWADKKNQDKENTITVAKYFIGKDGFKEIVSQIKIHEGKIFFTIKNPLAQLTVKFDGNFLVFSDYNIYSKEVKEESTISSMFDELYTLRNRTEKLMDIVYSADPLNANIIEWAKKAHEERYNVEKLEYDKY